MKNKLPGLVGGIFLFIGICMLISAIIAYVNNVSFIETAEKTNGVVTELILRKSAYYPVIQFRTTTNEVINFNSPVGSLPPSYRVGEEVTVFYDPANPYSATLNGFWSKWTVSIILSFLGVIFSFLGSIFLGGAVIAMRRKKWLLKNGIKISTEYQQVGVNRRLNVNGNHPFIIISQYVHPEKNTLYTFESDNIWYNPEKFITNKTIDVLVDPNNYKKYYVDISFLPKAA